MIRILTICTIIGCNYTYADGINSLKIFLNDPNMTLRSDFTQTVIGKRKNLISTGLLEISRPNKFRWEYTKEEQLIISDSKNLYVYDKPLQQVVQKKLTNTIGKSPALLLAGGTDIEHEYIISNISDNSDKLEWVSLIPKVTDDNNGFKSVQIGFKNKMLAQMKFTDSFDNKTMIEFTNIKTKITIPNSHFTFKPVAGVSIVHSN